MPTCSRRLTKWHGKQQLLDHTDHSLTIRADHSFLTRAIKRDESPFGGIQLILSGDFLQLPTVSRGKRPKRFCFQSDSWNEAIEKTMKLSQVKRQKDNAFIELLEEIRFGR